MATRFRLHRAQPSRAAWSYRRPIRSPTTGGADDRSRLARRGAAPTDADVYADYIRETGFHRVRPDRRQPRRLAAAPRRRANGPSSSPTRCGIRWTRSARSPATTSSGPSTTPTTSATSSAASCAPCTTTAHRIPSPRLIAAGGLGPSPRPRPGRRSGSDRRIDRRPPTAGPEAAPFGFDARSSAPAAPRRQSVATWAGLRRRSQNSISSSGTSSGSARAASIHSRIGSRARIASR